MAREWTTWVLADRRYHRDRPDGTGPLCGVWASAEAERVEADVLRQIGADPLRRKPICGRCDSLLQRIRGTEFRSDKPLSAEQQAIRDRLDAERVKRQLLRNELERAASSSSSSVRAVSGGLPSLGKRNR